MIKKIRIARFREKAPSAAQIALSSAVYFLGAVGVGLHDRGFLLLAWLMAGFLGVAVYLALDGRGSLINSWTVFFGAVVSANVVGYFAV